MRGLPDFPAQSLRSTARGVLYPAQRTYNSHTCDNKKDISLRGSTRLYLLLGDGIRVGWLPRRIQSSPYLGNAQVGSNPSRHMSLSVSRVQPVPRKDERTSGGGQVDLLQVGDLVHWAKQVGTSLPRRVYPGSFLLIQFFKNFTIFCIIKCPP